MGSRFFRGRIVVFILAGAAAYAHSDAERFAEGRAALEKFKDCPAARHAFESESQKARESAAWLDATARAAECVGDLVAALAYYQKESAIVLGSDVLSDKIGELRYRIAKQEEAQQQGQERDQAASDVAPTIIQLQELLLSQRNIDVLGAATNAKHPVEYQVKYSSPSCSLFYQQTVYARGENTVVDAATINFRRSLTISGPRWTGGEYWYLHIGGEGVSSSLTSSLRGSVIRGDKNWVLTNIPSQEVGDRIVALLKTASRTCRVDCMGFAASDWTPRLRSVCALLRGARRCRANTGLAPYSEGA